jgi:succinate dehydrogenase / fumarate reductase, membrane anchor subunit
MIDNPAKKKGTWAWLLQRVTAVLIIVFLGIHIFMAHFSDLTPAGEMLSWDSIQQRVTYLPLLIVDYGLLITAIFHGLNGLRMIGFDFVVNKTKRKAMDAALWVAGVVSVIWGLAIFAPFLGILGFD